jgi:hypothetical protein
MVCLFTSQSRRQTQQVCRTTHWLLIVSRRWRHGQRADDMCCSTGDYFEEEFRRRIIRVDCVAPITLINRNGFRQKAPAAAE